MRRAVPHAVGAAVAVAALLLSAASPAHAQGYRYWSFWQRSGGSWAYATQGPSTARPADGDVQGFRFSVSEDSADSAKPRGAADFASICSGTSAKAGAKRIALVIDFGTAGDAPDGGAPPEPRRVCARVARDATSGEALAAVARPLRYDSSAMLCAIAGFPRTGCGEQVGAGDRSAHAKPRAEDSDGGPSLGLLAGALAVVALGGAALWRARRRA